MSADAVYVATRDQLRGIAESLIAGPQYRAAHTIRLAVQQAGFVGVALPLGVHGDQFRWADGAVPLAGRAGALAAAAGLDFGPPEGVYEIVDALPADAVIEVDPAAADVLYRSLYAGRKALEHALPEQDPVLWPEHFDVAVSFDEVNYGVSAGDGYHPMPYAYVGPWTPREGDFWNAPFGAVLSLDPGCDVEALVTEVAAFFSEGLRQLAMT